MAQIIPSLSQVKSRMTAGERRVAEALRQKLEDDYLVWYDIPVGKKRRYPDFIILHPRRGLLFLEVKDWKTSTFKNISKNDVQILTDKGMVTHAHPIEQAKAYAFATANQLQRDKLLRQIGGNHAGQLKFPYAYGVVLTDIPRKNMHAALSEDARELVLQDHLVLYQEDLRDDVDAETFQEKLWDMFPYDFGEPLTLPEIDRIRWHLFPEIRIDTQALQGQLFGVPDTEVQEVLQAAMTEVQAAVNDEQAIPDVVKLMDLQQEQLARSLGAGHRVIHGVAGSGKTLILGYRCQYLAQTTTKPILVLCFNIPLAAKLRTMMASKGLSSQVQVYHFHDWCAEQLRMYHVDVISGSAAYFDRQVQSVITAVEKGQIPPEQYGAVMIDEGHDFAADWLRLITQMVHPDEDSLLLLYDDAQSIYQRSGLKFSLSSVGIKAQGRTTILRLNYRNSREVLQFAYEFAEQYLPSQTSDDDHIPLVAPESAGGTGPKPRFYTMPAFTDEVAKAVQCFLSWQDKDLDLRNAAVLVPQRWHAELVHAELMKAGIATQLLLDSKAKKAYQPNENSVAIMTLHASKGLEFSHVVVIGIGSMGLEAERVANDAKVLYVGMTRAQRTLVVTGSGEGLFVRQLLQQTTAAA